MNTQTTDLSKLYALTEADRIAARDRARQNIVDRIGKKPQRADFEQHTASKYPAYVTLIITLVMFALLAFAFVPSAMRVFKIASSTFGRAIPNQTQENIAGVSFVALAELATLGFVVAAGVLDVTRRTKILLYAAAISSTLIAVVGNIQIAIDHGPGAFAWFTSWLETFGYDPFAGLEAVAPPILTLIAGLVLEEITLASIQRRHSNERAYQNALAAWTADTADPEDHPQWRIVYAHALKAALTDKNGSGRGKTEREQIMQTMTDQDWRRLVLAELHADDWLLGDTQQDAQPGQDGGHLRPLSESPITGEPVSLAASNNGHGARPTNSGG